MNTPPRQALVYSCSGCSNAAQLANHVALTLDAEGLAEMSCIAGVGGKVPTLLRIAHSGRPIIALDGCILSCVSATLAQEGLKPVQHIRLDLMGVRKIRRTKWDTAQAEKVLEQVRSRLQALNAAVEPPTPSTRPLHIFPATSLGGVQDLEPKQNPDKGIDH